MESEYDSLLQELYTAILSIDAEKLKTKKGREKTNTDKLLYNPKELNTSIKNKLNPGGWIPFKLKCEYPTALYTKSYIDKYGSSIPKFSGATREIDFVKGDLGVEVQFGKYAFMAYDILGKMVILHNRRIINAGVEIVPVRRMSKSMSTGVSYFEQIVWDLENRGASNLDIPVLLIGIDS